MIRAIGKETTIAGCEIVMNRFAFALFTAVASIAAGPSFAVPVVADAVNPNAQADTLIFGGNVQPKVEHAWVYMPSFDFDLTGIKTKFSAADGRAVTLEIYDELPANGGTLLRSATFTALGNQFSGAFFAELALKAGEDYVIGFRNLAGLGVNTTTATGADELPAFFSFKDDGSYDTVDNFIFAPRVILQFFADNGLADVPEPAALGLFGAGLALLRLRRRREAVGEAPNSLIRSQNPAAASLLHAVGGLPYPFDAPVSSASLACARLSAGRAASRPT
jgi:PEP-CTERM motif-containing protein